MQTTRQIDLTQEMHEIIADVAEILSSTGATCAALYTDADGLLASVVVGDEEMPTNVTHVACGSSARPVALAAKLVADLFARMEV